MKFLRSELVQSLLPTVWQMAVEWAAHIYCSEVCKHAKGRQTSRNLLLKTACI